MDDFLCYRFAGLINRGAYFLNFTVSDLFQTISFRLSLVNLWARMAYQLIL